MVDTEGCVCVCVRFHACVRARFHVCVRENERGEGRNERESRGDVEGGWWTLKNPNTRSTALRLL